jgi:hypothetical protein
MYHNKKNKKTQIYCFNKIKELINLTFYGKFKKSYLNFNHFNFIK